MNNHSKKSPPAERYPATFDSKTKHSANDCYFRLVARSGFAQLRITNDASGDAYKFYRLSDVNSSVVNLNDCWYEYTGLAAVESYLLGIY